MTYALSITNNKKVLLGNFLFFQTTCHAMTLVEFFWIITSGSAPTIGA